MTAPYSVDLRERVVELKLTGQYTNQEIADIFMISVTSVKEYVRKFNNGETLIPEKPGGRKPLLIEGDKKIILNYVKDKSDATLQIFLDQEQHVKKS
jgi:transposase